MTSDKAKILIVDDRREDRVALAGIFANTDYEAVTATSGRDALWQLLRSDFAVILLDAHMPGMDGFELAAIIKQRERSRYTPILFLTAAGADMGALYRAYSVGAVDFLVKPIDPDVVQAKVAIFVQLFEKDRRIHAQAIALQAAERRQRDIEIAEQRLQSERRYRNLAEAIPEIVWTASPDGTARYFNQRWRDYTGLPLATSIDRGLTAALHPEDVEPTVVAWGGAMKTLRK